MTIDGENSLIKGKSLIESILKLPSRIRSGRIHSLRSEETYPFLSKLATEEPKERRLYIACLFDRLRIIGVSGRNILYAKPDQKMGRQDSLAFVIDRKRKII